MKFKEKISNIFKKVTSNTNHDCNTNEKTKSNQIVFNRKVIPHSLIHQNHMFLLFV